MKRILVIDPSRAVRETVAAHLAGEYELVQWDSLPEGAALQDSALGVDAVISSDGPPPWTSELKLLAARGTVAVLILADMKTAADFSPNAANLSWLGKPFSGYQLRGALERLLSRRSTGVPMPRLQATSYLDYPFVNRAAASLARRFASFSLPVLVWGELGCGQDRVARAMLSVASISAAVRLNGVDIRADYLNEKRSELIERSAPPVLLIEELERLSLPEQSMLLNFLDDVEGALGRLRLLATARADLLERVYRGEFLERLRHKLAVLGLPLVPLRERRDDIPALADWFADAYAPEIGIDRVRFTPAALDRLREYLWFGNIDEFEIVIAQTLAIQGKGRIDAGDIILNIAASQTENPARDTGPTVELNGNRSIKTIGLRNSRLAGPGKQTPVPAKGSAGGASSLRLLVHELAHELKNPMVTIKTFAQMLSERYDDASFRARFQNVVDGDIERMDDLLEVLMEFSGFEQPSMISVPLKEHLHSTLEVIQEECTKRKVSVGWKGNGQGVKIMADAAQLRYALKNTLRSVLSQTKTGSEIELALGDSGSLTISYLRDGERTHSLANYLDENAVMDTDNILPLRIMLAREIVVRSGGRFEMVQRDGEREIVTMEFPVV